MRTILRSMRRGARDLRRVFTTSMALAAPIAAQDLGSCEGRIVGDLGLIVGCRVNDVWTTSASGRVGTRLICSGSTAVISSRGEPGEDENYETVVVRYTAEPEVQGVHPGSPADGVLEAGDRLVSIDGLLITTAAGSRRLHGLEPGEEVRLTYRRDGRLHEASLRAVEGCEARRVVSVGTAGVRVGSAGGGDVVGVSGATVVGIESRDVSAVVTGDQVRQVEGQVASVGDPTVTYVAAGGNLAPGARLGISFACNRCTVRTSEDGYVRWSFTRPIEIERVEEGGPADEAGLRPGDLIREIDGAPVESREGSEALGAIEPGVPVQLTVSRPDGSFANVVVVPQERPTTTWAASGVSGGMSVGVGGAAWSASPSGEGGALRYSGALGGISVEVRGEPVNVLRDEGTRTITIYTGGNVITIRIPDSG